MDSAATHAVAMYKAGDPIANITADTGLTEHQIAAAVTRSGTPFITEKTANTAKPSASDSLIAWGMQHANTRMQRLAEQARTALADLQQAQRKEAVVTAAEERLAEARQQLADAEQALRTAKGSASPASSSNRPDKAEAALVRAWARDNGHQVGTAGVVPRHLVDAYRAAVTPA